MPLVAVTDLLHADSSSIVSSGAHKPTYVYQETDNQLNPLNLEVSENTPSSKDNPFMENASHQQSTIPNVEHEEKPWRCGDPYHYPLPKDRDPWRKCLEMTKENDKSMCENWKDEVQNLLIFAGLFSAVVTTFAVDSYKMLQEDPSTRLLTGIAVQLADSNGQNITALSSASASNLGASPSASAVRINVFWFVSLILALTTVLVGILCLQWLREFQRYDALPSKDALALRQMRHDGLVKWHVPTILAALPVLLQIALILFFAGILDLLGSLNPTVAIVMAALIGFIALFIAATTVLPSVQIIFHAGKMGVADQCPYKSPQSWAFYRLGHSIYSLAHRALCFGTSWSLWLTERSTSGWFGFDSIWRQAREKTHSSRDLSRALAWSVRRFKQSVDSVFAIYHCLSELEDVSAAGTSLGLNNIHDIGTDPILDILLARSLDELLAEKYWRQSTLMLLRLELYVRIKNARIHSTYVKNIYPGRDLHWLNIPPLWSPEDIDVPEELTLQLLDCIIKSFDKGTNFVRAAVDSFSIEAPWLLLPSLVSEQNPTRRICHSWDRLFISQKKWLRGYGADIYDQDHARQILEGMWNHLVAPASFPKLKFTEEAGALNDTYNSLFSLVECLDKAIYGAPPHWPHWCQLPEYVWKTFVSNMSAARQTPSRTTYLTEKDSKDQNTFRDDASEEMGG